MRALLVLLLLAGCNGPAPSSDASPERTTRAPSPPPAPTAGPDGSPDLGALPGLVHRAANGARNAEGVPALGWSDALAAIAAAHSRDMAARDFFAHDTPEGTTPGQRAAAAGIDCRIEEGGGRFRVGVAENLYMTSTYRQVRTQTVNGVTTRTVDWYSPADLANETIGGWLDSPGHRRNLLEPGSRDHGIGVAQAGEQVYVTQVLC